MGVTKNKGKIPSHVEELWISKGELTQANMSLVETWVISRDMEILQVCFQTTAIKQRLR